MNTTLLIIMVISIIGIVIYFVKKRRQTSHGVNNLDAEEAKTMIITKTNDKDFVILDVRTPEEFDSGHIAGSVNIDYHSSEFEGVLDTLNKDKTYLVYCRSGTRSSHAATRMENKNFQTVFNLTGGVIAWSQKKFPLN